MFSLKPWKGDTLLDSWFAPSGSSVLMLEGSQRAHSRRTYTVTVKFTVQWEENLSRTSL